MAWPSGSAVPSASEGKIAAQRPGAGRAGLAGCVCTTGKPASAPMAVLSAGAGGAGSCGPLPCVSSGGNACALEGRHHCVRVAWGLSEADSRVAAWGLAWLQEHRPGACEGCWEL